MAKHEELIEELFTKHVKPMKLPPRLAGQIKQRMEAAAKKSKGDKKTTKAAIAEYLNERGYDPETGKKLKKKPKKAKGAKPKKASKKSKEDDEDEEEEEEEEAPKKKKGKRAEADPAKEKLEAAGAKKALKGDADAGVPAGNIDLRKLNRMTMKGMAKDLGVGYKKKWTDDELRTKLAKVMIGVDEKVTAAIAKADPNKIDALDNCIGVLIDLSKAICITCPAQEDCRTQFEAHRENGFKIFDKLAPGSEQTDPTVVPAASLTKKSKALPKPTEAFNADRKIEVYEFDKVKELPKVEVDGAAVKSNMAYKVFLRDLKASVPDTLGEFRDVVLKHYTAEDSDTDAVKLVMWFVRYCTALEVIKLV